MLADLEWVLGEARSRRCQIVLTHHTGLFDESMTNILIYNIDKHSAPQLRETCFGFDD